jgi:hypothetical protein
MKLGILDFRVLRRFNPFARHYDKVVASNVPQGTTRNVAKINVTTKVVSIAMSIPEIPNNRSYNNGCLAPNGKIYCSPRSANNGVLVIDPSDDTYYFITGMPTGNLKWGKAAIIEGGIMYCSPRNQPNFLKVDTNNDTWSLLPSPTGSYADIGLAQNGILYCTPFSAANILKVDTNTDTVTTFGSLGGAAKWNSAILVGHYIYALPYRSSVVLRIDIRDDSISTFGSHGTFNDKWVDGAILENGFIYGCPSSADSIIKVDPVAGTSSEWGVLARVGGQKWRGACVVKGEMYCAPNGLTGFVNNEDILVISNDGITEFFNEELTTSGYYSN